MKNKQTFLLFFVLIGLASCTKQTALLEDIKVEKLGENLVSADVLSISPFNVLGNGYNVTGEFGNVEYVGEQVIDVSKLSQIANRVRESDISSQQFSEEYGENAQQFSKMISNKIDLTASYKVFGKNISVDFGYLNIDSTRFDAKYIYGSTDLLIKNKRYSINAGVDLLKDYLTSAFVLDVNSRSPKEIVEHYGTHVLLDIYTGAKLSVKYEAETDNHNRTNAARAGVKLGMEKVFNLDYTNNVNILDASQNFNSRLVYKTRGGDPSKGLRGEISMDKEVSTKINIANWQNSTNPTNAVLVDIGRYGVIHIYDLVSDPVKKSQLKSYVDQYLAANTVNLKYIPSMLHGHVNVKARNHYFSFGPYLQPTSYWTGEGPAFKVYTYQAENTVPIYCYYSTSGTQHYYSKSSSIQPASYWDVYQGVAFYAYDKPGAGRKPIYNYINKYRDDHYLSDQEQLEQGYWFREGLEFYAPIN